MENGMSQWQVIDALNGSLLTSEYLNEAARLGGVVLNMTVNNFTRINTTPSLADAMLELARCRNWLTQMHDKVMLVATVSDLNKAFATRKVGITLGYQNIPGIDNAVELLSLFHALGVRIIQITHNDRNLLGDGCSEPANAGLSNLGRKVVQEMNRLGIVIDLSHVGEATSLEVMKVSTQPVAITHGNAAALIPRPRNKSDRILDALAANDGVIGITFLPSLVTPQGQKSTMDDVLAQVDYISRRIGARHVGIGSDFITGQPQERYAQFLLRPDVYAEWSWEFPISGITQLNDLFIALLHRGYSEEDVRAIAGGNFRRLFGQVWSNS